MTRNVKVTTLREIAFQKTVSVIETCRSSKIVLMKDVNIQVKVI